MSLAKNAIYNVISQVYVAISGVIVVPYFVKILGPDGYGLIGFYALMQAWLSILDMGMSSTLSREASKASINQESSEYFRRVFKLITTLFLILAIAIFIIGSFSVNWITKFWINAGSLDKNILFYSVQLIVAILALRWMSSPFRFVLIGFEKQIPVAMINILSVTLKFPVGVLWLNYVDSSLVSYFIFQLSISILELISLFVFSELNSPYRGRTDPVFTFDFIRTTIDILKFSAGVAFISLVWVCVTQVDKLVLSSYLTLESFGYYSMAIVIANGITLLAGPIGQAVLPRLTALNAEGNDIKYVMTYRRMTNITAACLIPIGVFLSVFSYEAVFVWTGNYTVSQNVYQILRWYALGNTLLALASFPYFIQYSKGVLKYHIVGNLIFAIFIIPAIIFSAKYYGSIGAAKVWFIQNLFYFLCWSLFVHFKFERKIAFSWLVIDTLPYFILPICISIGIKMCLTHIYSRWFEFAILSLSTVIVIVVNLIVRAFISRRIM